LADYGVTLTHLTEREGPHGGRKLTGRLGDAVVIGTPLRVAAGAAPRWRLTLVEPMRRGGPDGTSLSNPDHLDQLAARADRREPRAEG
jgi:hypothetical protein